jgi:hypothetical protein
MVDQPDKFNRRLIRVDELRAKVQQYDRAYRIINAATQLAEFRRFTADSRLSASEASGAQRATMQLKRDKEFVAAIKEGAVEMEKILKTTLDRLDDKERHEERHIGT